MAKTKTVPIDPLMGLGTAETLVQYIDILLGGMNAGGDYVGERWFIESMVNEDIVDAMKRYGIAVADVERVFNRGIGSRQYEHIEKYFDYVVPLLRGVFWVAFREDFRVSARGAKARRKPFESVEL